MRKFLQALARFAIMAGPLLVGMAHAPRVSAQSQIPAAPLAFEVASIKPADPNSRGVRMEITPGGSLRASGVTLKALIEMAFDIQDFQISGGPDWFRTDRYDIIAKPERPEGPSDSRQATDAEQRSFEERFRERMRSLLAERFQLSIHRETAERPVFILILVKNRHKLQAVEEEGDGIIRNRGLISGDGVSTEMNAKVLSGVLARPVNDKTGLTGKYKFKLEWTEEAGAKGKDGIPNPVTDPVQQDLPGPSIFSAIQEQLGLKLESQKGTVEIIVIDRVRKPTPN